MKIGITGAGAMAQEVKKLVLGRQANGEDISLCGMYEPLGDGIIEDAFDDEPDVIIDFSNPANIWEICDYAEEHNAALVIATTGFGDEDKERMNLAGRTVPVVFSANYSLGITVLQKVAEELASVLGDDFDIEIIEKHHKRKLDAPSGTALLLADAINSSGRYEFTYGRYGSSRRKELEVGVHAVRGGGIVGEHSIIFAGDDEVIEISHSAGSRKVFAAGAIKAARFALESEAGVYGMRDVLWGRA